MRITVSATAPAGMLKELFTFYGFYSILFINSIIKLAEAGDADLSWFMVIFGTFFLLFVQYIFYDLQHSYEEVPMKKTVLVTQNITEAVLSIIFNLGTSILAGACLQTQLY